MRLSRTAIVGALIFAALFGGYKYFDFAGDTAHPYVPPKENADGTIDYTLIFMPLRKYGGSYWVLRFPKDWAVIPSEAEDPGEVRLPGGKVWDFNAVPNWWVKVRLDYTTLKPLPKDAPAPRTELWIYANANPLRLPRCYNKANFELMCRRCER